MISVPYDWTQIFVSVPAGKLFVCLPVPAGRGTILFGGDSNDLLNDLIWLVYFSGRTVLFVSDSVYETACEQWCFGLVERRVR